MKVHIHISRYIIPEDVKAEQRYLTWVGEVEWPSVPSEGSLSWCHCGGWAIERIHAVYFNGPPVLNDPEHTYQHAPISIEIKIGDEITMDHLVKEHGFEDSRY